MQASEIQISNFLAKNGTKFVIPVYQRNYDWRQKQCQQLLHDLESLKNSQNAYFIGSIVHQSTRNLTNNTELIIIDGQQRITTLTLLLLALNKRFKEFGDEQKAAYIEETYLINKYDANQNKLKLKPVNEDNTALKNVVDGNMDLISDGHRIRENFEFFYNMIQTLEEANLYFESFPKLTIVEISLDERDDPQKIFQSLNSTGLELSQADLIRNYILMNLPYEQQEKYYSRFWSVIEKNCRNELTFESDLSMFMRDYLTLKYNKMPAKTAIYDFFIEKNPQFSQDLEKLEALLEEITRYSKYYSALINNTGSYSTQIKAEIENINKLDVNVSYPFLLAVMDSVASGDVSEDVLIKILQLVQNFVLRRFLCDLPSNALQKIFMSLFSNAQKFYQKNPTKSFDKAVAAVLLKLSSYQRFPNDEEVKASLEHKDIYRAQWRKRNYLLENLENKYNQFNETFLDIDQREDITIEHIFPQNPSKDFKEQLGEEQYKKMQSLANTLGNLTLVINNSSLGNRSFLEKRDLDKPESKGFRYSKFNLNESIQNLDKWDLDELQNRNSLLTSKVLEIWNFPEIDLTQYELEESLPVSIFEIDDPKGTQPKAVYVNGSKKAVTSNREMFVHVIEYVHSREPEAFFKPKVKESLGLSDAPNPLRKQSQLNADTFYDTGLSAWSIYTRLRTLLESAEEEYEVLVQFKEEEEN